MRKPEDIVEVKKAHVYRKDGIGYVLYLVHQDGILVLTMQKSYLIYTSEAPMRSGMFTSPIFETWDWLVTVTDDGQETRFEASTICVYQTADSDIIIELINS